MFFQVMDVSAGASTAPAGHTNTRSLPVSGPTKATAPAPSRPEPSGTAVSLRQGVCCSLDSGVFPGRDRAPRRRPVSGRHWRCFWYSRDACSIVSPWHDAVKPQLHVALAR